MPVPPQPANPIIRQHQVVLDQINLLLTHLCTLARDAQKHDEASRLGSERDRKGEVLAWNRTDELQSCALLQIRDKITYLSYLISTSGLSAGELQHAHSASARRLTARSAHGPAAGPPGSPPSTYWLPAARRGVARLATGEAAWRGESQAGSGLDFVPCSL